MTREETLDNAKRIVTGKRDDEYGGPEDNFSRIAALWSAYLGTDVGAEDVAIMMVLLKISRLAASFYESMDSWVDIAGYAACGAEIATRDKVTDDKPEVDSVKKNDDKAIPSTAPKRRGRPPKIKAEILPEPEQAPEETPPAPDPAPEVKAEEPKKPAESNRAGISREAFLDAMQKKRGEL